MCMFCKPCEPSACMAVVRWRAPRRLPQMRRLRRRSKVQKHRLPAPLKLPLKIPEIPFNRDRKTFVGGTLRSLGAANSVPYSLGGEARQTSGPREAPGLREMCRQCRAKVSLKLSPRSHAASAAGAGRTGTMPESESVASRIGGPKRQHKPKDPKHHVLWILGHRVRMQDCYVHVVLRIHTEGAPKAASRRRREGLAPNQNSCLQEGQGPRPPNVPVKKILRPVFGGGA